MVDLILRPSNLAPDKPWALQLRWHESLGPTEYFTLVRVGNHVADEIIRAGAPSYLFDDKEPEGTDLKAEIERLRAELAGLKTAPQVDVQGLSKAMLDVIAERRRQIKAEGWTTEHDDEHDNGELSSAAACYLRPDLKSVVIYNDHVSFNDPWPWWNDWDDGGRCSGREKAWWKPADKRRNLEKAAALIIAEIERIDRAASASEVK